MATETLDGGAVQEVAKLAEAGARIQHLELPDGRNLAGNAHNFREVYDPEAESWPAPLRVHSLTGLTDYLDVNPDQLAYPDCILIIEGPDRVALESRALGPKRKRIRFRYVEAMARDLTEDLFKAWLPVEEMVIALQSRFQDAVDRARVLALLGNVTDEAIATSADDGVTQKVSVRVGVSLEDQKKVPNPVRLRPFRTFPEVEEQPESPFILRLRKGQRGPEAALFEADGGAWMQDALDAIVEWIKAQDEVGYPEIIG
jgi:hypothetical protein